MQSNFSQSIQEFKDPEILYYLFMIISRHFQHLVGAPVAQWVKRWPTDLVVASSSPAQGEAFSSVSRVPLHKAFH